jgi:hypothetical protein
MAGVGQGVTGEQDERGSAEAPAALRIDMDAFATLSGAAGDGGDTPTIVSWFDCWRS